LARNIAKAFGNIPVDSENMDFFYSRRHLATVRDGKWREPKYIVEFDELAECFHRGGNELRYCYLKCGLMSPSEGVRAAIPVVSARAPPCAT
jgi:hypothetical protein